MTKSIHSPEMQALLNWLREIRENQGISMREMGERIGRPHSFVQKVEVGERRLDVVEFIWYCEALGVQPQTGMDIVQSYRARLKNTF
ncbi:helix-turn-helix transcriptional regulator [Serratia plymuthica]|uniref:helix-turn-helix domain-containing protein n=1 Tax=Enterobacterales TaxID=91347 RepID=UPI001BAE6499|nr:MULTISPECIES: helix-turn-helix transcriptional regulator [Enterobacterales]QUY48700.1 helix-turn-helix transcriptional regulator [Serratia plymuthica]WJV38545.1 helix-turn-helix transcriptional regulator [Raoultella terrigena]